MGDKNKEILEENVLDKDVTDVMKTAYINYAMNVIVSRAIPDVRDGLKPVHRRILYGMKGLGITPNGSTKKSARIVGECFVKGTMVSTPNGLIPIEELKKGDKVYTTDSIEKVTNLFIMPKKELLKVELENGLKNIVTKEQMFKVINKDLSYSWKKANELTKDDYIVGKQEYLDSLEHQNKSMKIVDTYSQGLIPYLGLKLVNEFSEKHLDGFDNKSSIDIPLKKDFKVYKSTLHSTDILSKMKVIGSKYLDFVQFILDNDLVFMKVKEVLPSREEETYDIEVEHKHEFIANGMISHNCIGKYHPHGDSAVYEAMVRMGQDFSYRYPLVIGQGNFGSIDGDPAAAHRYTEAKTSHLAEEMMRELDKNTVPFIDNYDGSEQEPVVLPSRVPNLLINGTSGIAVGMASNMPPHQLGEAIDAIVAFLEDPDINIEGLMNFLEGPDFPTGGMIIGKKGIKDAYETGRGRITVRGMVTIEEGNNGRPEVVISEIPYGINKPRLIEKIAELVREERIEDISDIRDESDKEGIRIIIELKRGANPQQLVQQLYKLTDLQTTFGVINLAIVDNTPQVLNLKEIIEHYVEYQREVIERRTKFDLERAERRAHILEGLVIVGSNVDDVVQAIRTSRNPDTARRKLMRLFKLSEKQSQAVLDLRLQRITGLEVNKTKEELDQINSKINEYREILSDVNFIDNIIKEELLDIKEKYNDERRTRILDSTDEQEFLDKVVRKRLIIAISQKGYVFSTDEGLYARQTRGGRGASAFRVDKDDFIKHIFTCTSDQILGLFTENGQFFKIPVTEIPEIGRNQRGNLAYNLAPIKSGDKIATFLTFHPDDVDKTLYFASKKGLMKKMSASEILNSRNGVLALRLRNEDKLLSVFSGEDDEEFLVATLKGQSIRFTTESIRPMGRVASGVTMINMDKDDKVIGIDLVKNGNFVVVLTSLGHGKRVPLSEFRCQNRGGKGARIATFTENHGDIIGIHIAYAKEDVLLTYNSGRTIRLHIRDFASMTRDTTGGKVIDLDKGDFITNFVVMKYEEEVST